jgi:uncharacterized membrane protein
LSKHAGTKKTQRFRKEEEKKKKEKSKALCHYLYCLYFIQLLGTAALLTPFVVIIILRVT